GEGGDGPGRGGQEGGGSRQAGTGGGQLDRQRHAIQPPADLRHRAGVVRGEGEIRANPAGPVDEEFHGRLGRQFPDGGGGRVGGQRQRRHRVLPLGSQPQHRPAG